MDKSNTLGSRIKERRKLLKLTAHKLAVKCGISATTLYRAERGDILQLKSDALRQLANELQTSIDFLVGRTDKPTAENILANDSDARLLFSLYDGMDSENTKTLLAFAEYTKYRPLALRELLEAYNGLYEFTTDIVKGKKWKKNDSRYKRAQRQMSDIAIKLALNNHGTEPQFPRVKSNQPISKHI